MSADTTERTPFFVVVAFVLMVAIVAVFDVTLIGGMWRQLEAERHPIAQGEVLASEVVRERATKGGRRYTAQVRYTYTVDGRRYESDIYRRAPFPSNRRTVAEAVAREHAPGAAVFVRYNPRDPADAMLRPGLAGPDVFLLLFMTPFNIMAGAILAGGAAWLLRVVRGEPKPPPDLGEGSSPFAYAMAAAFFAAFLSAAAIIFTGGGFYPSMPVAIAGWVVTLAGAAGVFIWCWTKARRA